jgi:LuxR family transcriptional regulator, maltose regulon positive regulatory protein
VNGEKEPHASLPLKTQPPNPRKVIRRQRLFDLLSAPPHSPLVWVSGPAGSGKTTFVKTYLDSIGQPFLWYKIDARDGELLTFFHFFGSMVDAHLKDKGGWVPTVQQDIPFNVKTFSESLLGAIVPPVTIVFDNYQDLPGLSPLDDVVRVFLDELPAGISFIFISREEPPHYFARFQATHGMKRITGKDLQLTPAEAVQIARLRRHRLQRKLLDEILECANGWAAGFTLLLEGRKDETQGGCRGEVRPKIIHDYFEELFEKVSPDCQEFLLRTPFLPYLTHETTGQLRVDRLSTSILDQLCKDNLFTEKIMGSEERYAYHPLFQEFLQKKAQQFFTSFQLKEIWRRCAVLVAESDPESAIALFKRAEEWKALEKLTCELGPKMVAAGRHDALDRLIGDLPAVTREGLPWLLYWAGVAKLPTAPEAATASFEKAFRKFEEAGDLEGLVLSWCGIVESIGTSKRNIGELDAWIERMGKLLPKLACFTSKSLQANVTFAMTVALVLRSRDHEEIERWSGEVLSIEPGPEALLSQSYVLRKLVVHSFWKGKFEQGAYYLTRLKKRTRQPHSPALAKLQCCLGETAYGMFTGNYEQCMRNMSEGLHLAEKSGVHVLDYQFLGFAALCAIDRGEAELAEQFAGMMEPQFHDEDSLGECLHSMIRAKVALLKGAPDEAVRILNALYLQSDLFENPILHGCLHLVSANTMLSMGYVNQAREHLLKARQITAITESELMLFFADMCAAQIALDQEDHGKCRDLLREALKQARTGGLHYHLVDNPAATSRLFSFALCESIEPGYVRQVIAKRRLTPHGTATEIESWPWPFKITTLGLFSIERDGRPLTFAGKAPQKQLALLKLLIAYGGQAVHEPLLTEALWPDAEGDTARSAFSTTLGRLRRIMGDEKLFHHSERQLTLNPGLCWVDLWSFEKELDAIRGFDGEPELARVHLARVFDLYRGPFLSGEKNEQEFAPTRERLCRKFEWVVHRLVGQLECSGAYEECIEAYELSLEREPAVESFYEGIMRCFVALGMGHKAIEAFNRCQMVLSRSIGIVPSMKITALRNTIRKEQAALRGARKG